MLATLAEAATYLHTDADSGRQHRITLPAGSTVYIRELGPARPTMHGGGTHASAVDLNTGDTFPAIVNLDR